MKRILKLLGFGLLASMVVSAVAALMVKRSVEPSGDEDSNDVTLVSIFGPLEFASRAQSLRSIRLECWFGGGILDLRDAVLEDGLAHLEVRLVFGGGELVVPQGWRVTYEAKGLGGIGDQRDDTDELPADAPELVIDGLVMFGGLGITSEPNN